MSPRSTLAGLVVLAGIWVFSSTPALAAHPETPVTEAPTLVTGTTATLNGELNPGTSSEEDYYRFQYGDTEAVNEYEYYELETSKGRATGNHRKVTIPVTNLVGSTEYSYRLEASLSAFGGGEEAFALPVTFTTPPSAPVVRYQGTFEVTRSAATLDAGFNPAHETATCDFEYGTTAAYGTSVPCEPGEEEEGGYEFTSLPVSGLAEDTTYHYRVVVTNKTGPTEGPDQTFTTPGKPLAATGEASNVTPRTATLTGTVTLGGESNPPATEHFVYVDQAGYEAGLTESPADPYAKGLSTSEASVGVPPPNVEYTPGAYAIGPDEISELQPGTTYHYALVASNGYATEIGNDQTFTTAATTPPVATTGEAVSVGQYGATLTGSVDTRGLRTTMQFEFGTAPESGSLETATVGSETGTVAGISTTLSGYLQPGTTYYYRVLASSEDGTSYGTERSFTTSALPAPTPSSVVSFPGFVLPAFPAEAKSSTSTKALTRAQELAKALKVCGKKPKKQRAGCERQARRKYGPVAKKKKAKKH